MKKILLGLALSPFLIFTACGNDETDVSVKRSNYNYPSIRVERSPKGKSVETLFFWQGYIHATDRFQQMDMIRRVVKGQLSEIFGDKAEMKDRQSLALGLRRAVEMATERTKIQYPYEYSLIEAYAKGVNRFIYETLRNQTLLVRTYQAISFTAKEDPRPLFPEWTPSDSIAIADAVAFSLSSSLPRKMIMGMLAKDLWNHRDKVDFDRLFDHRPIAPVFTLDSASVPPSVSESVSPSVRNQTPFGVRLHEVGFPFSPSFGRESFGSNVAVVGQELTEGRETILFGDPHVDFTLPHTFIENALSIAPEAQRNEPMATEYASLVGMSFPGAPGIIMGHNGTIGFQSTNHAIAADDGYVEFENAEGTKVNFRNGWVDIEKINYDLKVRNVDGTLTVKPVVVRWVPHHGPIISDHFPEIGNALNDLASQHPGKKSISYKWVGHKGNAPAGLGGTTELGAVLKMNRAKNFQDFSSALIDGFEVGAQNFMYADTVGNIGYVSPGRVPLRNFSDSGLVPALGTGEMEWEPHFRNAVPLVFNPPKHRIVNSNNDPYGYSLQNGRGDYRNRLGQAYDSGFRAERGTSLIDTNLGHVTVDLVKQIQNDTFDGGARKLILGVLGPEVSNLRLSNQAKDLVRDFLRWDFNYKRDGRLPVLFESWTEKLCTEYFQQTFSTAGVTSPAVAPFIVGEERALAFNTTYWRLVEMLADPAKQLMARSIISASLESTVNSLPNPEVRWGQKNVLRFHNFLEGIIPPLSFLPIERDGSSRTYNVAGPTHGPNFRMILIFEKGKPIRGFNVLLVGNYDIRNSTEWMRELALWDRGEYRELTSF